MSSIKFVKIKMMAKVSKSSFRKELVGQMITLSTSAFGLAAALAWNDTIQQTVKEFIEPRLPGSGILSRFIYAALVTILGVIVTFQLSRLSVHLGIKK